MKQLISWTSRHIPRQYLQSISAPIRNAAAFCYQGDQVYCPVEERSYRKFLPYGRIEPRANALCPGSLTLERHRLMWLYLQEKTDFFTSKKKVLHIAPEICFVDIFAKMNNLDYMTADLDSPWAQIKMDIHDIPYIDNIFDVVFCNHVMEHVEDDIRCMSELYRVLKPGGWAIIQSPVYDIPETYENPLLAHPIEREIAFGQRDHVRKYGRDYADRLRKAGFEVTEDDFVSQFMPEQIRRYALMEGEIIYFCQKK